MSTHDELFALVRERPDDEGAWAVLQDWLLAHDDPRGKLAAASSSEVPRVLAELAPQWFGRPVTIEGNAVSMHEDLQETWSPGVRLEFERGHVRKLTVSTRWDGRRGGWGQAWMYPLLTRILSQPMAQLIFEMEIRATPNSEFGYAGLIETITAQGPLAVRELYCGDDDQHSWTNVPDITSLWAAAPWLEKVVLEGSHIELGELRHEKLRHLELISGGLPTEPVESLVRAHLPALQHLDLWFGAEEYGSACTAEDVQPLLERDFAKLRHMGLRNCEFSDALVPGILQASWLPQLQSLSLADSILREEGGRALLEAAASLRHLKELDLDDCYLPPDLYAQLQQALAGIVTGAQREPDEDGDERYYYVSLGE